MRKLQKFGRRRLAPVEARLTKLTELSGVQLGSPGFVTWGILLFRARPGGRGPGDGGPGPRWGGPGQSPWNVTIMPLDHHSVRVFRVVSDRDRCSVCPRYSPVTHCHQRSRW